MTKEEIKKKVLEYEWEPWIGRPFGAFFASLFKGHGSEFYFEKTGVNVEPPTSLFQNGTWYESEQVWDIFCDDLQKFIDKGGNVFDVSKQCENYLDKNKRVIEKLILSNIPPKEKLSLIYEIFSSVTCYIWLVHGFERLYKKILWQEVPRYMKGDLEKNIGDISYPIKKNAHYYFEQALKSDMPIDEVLNKFAWIKSRGGFDDGFTKEELFSERQKLKSNVNNTEDFVRPEIPDELKELVKISQELVYFRTLRTDVLYELMWRARPIMTEIADFFDLTFKELRDYSALDLLEGKKEKYEYNKFSAISLGEHFFLFHEPVIFEKKHNVQKELKGVIAFKGTARGAVKVVMVASEIGKVEEGDILVAPTTAPSYIMGMKKASAFIADEGGITSHTAIVAREMKKPCIIGTKIATKVLKDGDLVEVDANNGIVKIIK